MSARKATVDIAIGPDGEISVIDGTPALVEAIKRRLSPVDYRALLVKYIRHVRENEGTDYTDLRSSPGHGPEFFTDAERAELQRLAAEEARG